jgi:hypothetical protein
MTDIKKEIAKLLKAEYGISEEVTAELFERRILSEHVIKNALIREEYLKRIRPKEKQILKGKIAEKYFVSMDCVRKIVENRYINIAS